MYECTQGARKNLENDYFTTVYTGAALLITILNQATHA